MHTYDVEYTDTFSGEANYSWARRTTIAARSDIAAVRAAKAFAGLSGMRCSRDEYHGAISLRPVGCCTVLFITQVA